MQYDFVRDGDHDFEVPGLTDRIVGYSVVSEGGLTIERDASYVPDPYFTIAAEADVSAIVPAWLPAVGGIRAQLHPLSPDKRTLTAVTQEGTFASTDGVNRSTLTAYVAYQF